MKKLSVDQWMGVALAVMAALVLTLSILEIKDDMGDILPIGPGDPMPALAARDLEGIVVSLPAGSTEGAVLLLDFWATWCPPCVKSMPDLAALHRKYEGQGLRVLSMNVDQAGSHDAQSQLVRDFLARLEIPDLPVALDNGRNQIAYKVQVLPTLFLIGRDGVIVDAWTGGTRKSTIERAILEALEAPDQR